MNCLIDKAIVNYVGKLNWFGMFQNVVLYCQTVKWHWTELAQDRATVNCLGKMHWFGMFQNVVLYCQTVKWHWTELAH